MFCCAANQKNDKSALPHGSSIKFSSGDFLKSPNSKSSIESIILSIINVIHNFSCA